MAGGRLVGLVVGEGSEPFDGSDDVVVGVVGAAVDDEVDVSSDAAADGG